MLQPSRRLHARYLCKLNAQAWMPGAKVPFQGTVLNVGRGGAFVRVKGVLKDDIRLDLTSGRDVFSLDAKVVRTAGRDPKDPTYFFFGVEFDLSERSQNRIRLLVDRIRSGMDSAIKAPPLRDYWSV